MAPGATEESGTLSDTSVVGLVRGIALARGSVHVLLAQPPRRTITGLIKGTFELERPTT